MKDGIRYLVVSLVSLGLVIVLMVAAVHVKPSVFDPLSDASSRQRTALDSASQKKVKSSPSDSTVKAAVDTSAVLDSMRAGADTTAGRRDSLVSSSPTSRQEVRQTGQEVQSLSVPGTVPALIDSGHASDRKYMAKFIDAMSPENAVRILKGMTDDEVKAILLTLKKRQAAKILSSIDPERAARLMR